MDYFEIARVLKPQGIKGELKVEAYTDDMDNFSSLKTIYTFDGKEYIPHAVEKIRISMDIPYIKLREVSTRNDAELFRNHSFYIDRNDASPLEEGQYYLADLIGLRIVTDNDEELGILEDVLDNGAGLIYQVRGEKNIMFPLVPDLELQTDLEKGYILLDSNILKNVMVENDI